MTTRKRLTNMNDKWDLRFMDLAREISSWSKDRTKIGAVAVGSNRRILSTGYNGFPRNIDDDLQRYKDREQKYKYVVHAEQNCIYNACFNGISLQSSTLYVWGLPVCNECAKGIIQVGIERVVLPDNVFGSETWNQRFLITKDMFAEANVKITILVDYGISEPLDLSK